MTRIDKIYKSILSKISTLDLAELEKNDAYLNSLKSKTAIDENTEKILSLAGAWNDMSDEDFEEFQRITKETRESMSY